MDEEAEGAQVGEGGDEHEDDRDFPAALGLAAPRVAMTSAASTTVSATGSGHPARS
jgi:hypothetical protein